MLNRLIASVLTALALTTGSYATDIKGIASATFELYSGGTQNCSTQVVKSDDTGTTVITAFHCIEDTTKTYSLMDREVNDEGKIVSEKKYIADVVTKNRLKDVAVLELRDKEVRLPTMDVATVEEANATLELGVHVLAVGFPASGYDTQLTITEGLFNGRVNSLIEGLDYPFYRTTSTISPGNSGGGLYAEIDGTWKLVGISSQRDPSLPGTVNLFAPIEGIDAALNPEEPISMGDLLKGLNDAVGDAITK